ncbi:hypothetical protein [Stutzerimonas nitrititolerans]|uniref:hypothetical protein n=1 Tax=Stutzerimonas nitrititolerans TaxID=2482751 RepID=UPI0028B1C7E5|nr:hypothetical protein [Stutzerimonas nitrititolerans]
MSIVSSLSGYDGQAVEKRRRGRQDKAKTVEEAQFSFANEHYSLRSPFGTR